MKPEERDRQLSLRSEKELTPTQFTPMSEDVFYATVDSPEFYEQDAELIYRTLLDRLKPFSFGEYLKRYIYRKTELTLPFEEVSLSEYQNIIAESFADRGVPVSFKPSSGRVRLVSKNWLTQNTVNRDVVLLLGFGLCMQLEEVEELLMKGLHEARLNRTDLREVICGYCYAHGFGFHKYEYLLDLLLRRKENSREKAGRRDPAAKEGAAWHPSIRELRDDESLLRYGMTLLTEDGAPMPEDRTGSCFQQLYRRAQEVTADLLNRTHQEDLRLKAERSREDLPRGDQPDSCPKADRPNRQSQCGRSRAPEDITPADLEKVLQAGVPVDRHGNLAPLKGSTLNSLLRGKRFSRQRIQELLAGNAQVTRYDLILLQFFLFSQQKKENDTKILYYRRFVDQTNRMLDSCGLGPLYAANPFESFLLMCILSEDPLGTYTDVMEQSYGEGSK